MFWIALGFVCIGLVVIATGLFMMSFTVSVDGMRDISSRNMPDNQVENRSSKTASNAIKVNLAGILMTALGFLLMWLASG